MDNPKVEVRSCNHGQGLFAKSKILKGEEIATFDGKIYQFEDIECEEELNFWLLQIGERTWINSKGIANKANHSCDPNCGIKNKITLVAMRNIDPGEEITFDYEMSEDTWEMEKGVPYLMECHCGSPICRKKIGSFKNLPAHLRKKYKGYISEWLVEKYHL